MSTPPVQDVTITKAPAGLLTVDPDAGAPADGTPPKRSKVTAGLAVLACVACCTLPPALIAAGVITGAAGALAESVLFAVSGVLVVAAAGMWWLHRRRTATANACQSGCGCGGGC
ncbi:hypothetical protein [Cellulomonas cellasea]|uniref:Mercuric ion transport protein n=1 Tax=Cellulomonas cellasea TaxID=43670 RepID=A0A7W4UHP5_9CELL|nr:hypothetical protein [Cellulomonas cellasea]MBB2924351.1 mercuric ion transport protein [Cellulomonas cellasea]